VDSIISSVKKRSESAKNPMMRSVAVPSLQELLDSIPDARYTSKRDTKRKNAEVLTEHQCECGTMFTRRKNMLAHQRKGCRISEILSEIRDLHEKLLGKLVPLTQAPQRLQDLLKKDL
jgi:hypothetical protein